ncbi:PREDICTED: metallo-beta-lactamase domain-containing protein 1 [Nicrophorus vespilloides]|uniref:Metallo-beta-lactamase domain-containing protein 1 n=1 Tax=Nicrophorus vespilloides TaxID=110193 RepID=A0ABM1N8J4_NICVS|nr:PREDICTED: metallo-beta-lactamase domain-containing protein 1 [Nicrophorus vespilloides]
MSYEIIVLFDGYSKNVEEGMLANCTCTLIKGPKNIIVDTMTAWDGDFLRDALHAQNLQCSDIDYVICSHGHSDHIGCNYLFQNATHIVGHSISHKVTYYDHDFSSTEYQIDENIKVIATPGHTLQDVSVIVQKGNAIYAITGDLFEKEEDLEDDTIWRMAGSDDEKLQEFNRKKILGIADYVIPGHGPMFKNKLKCT